MKEVTRIERKMKREKEKMREQSERKGFHKTAQREVECRK